MPERTIEDPVLRQRFQFHATTGPDGEDVLVVEGWVDPGGGVMPHVHPAMEERFTVVAGTLSVLAGRRWLRAEAGETVPVAPGVRHAYRNDTGETVHYRCEARPPAELQGFLEDAAALSRAGRFTRRALPRGPAALLEAVVLAEHYADTVVLLFPPMPPPWLQRLVVPALARLGRRRGFRPGVGAVA